MLETLFRHRNIPIDELSRIVAPIARKNNVQAVYLFGSRARGDFARDSDYDFLIDVPDNYTMRNYCGFMDQLSDALGKKVDVVTRRSLKDNGFGKTVLREAILVYG